MMRNKIFPLVALALLVSLAAVPPVARAQDGHGESHAPAADTAPAQHDMPDMQSGRMESAPGELEGVGIDENMGGQLPLDAEFTNSDGDKVRLGDIIDGDKPVILTLGYLKCTMLCHLILRGLTQTISELDWTLGDQYEIVSISIDPRETPAFAKINKQKYIKMYGRPEGAAGWHYLTGENKQIKKVADTAGFNYEYSEKDDMYLHTAAIFIITPNGRISRYLYGVAYDPVTLRMSMLEASEGRLGTTVDRIIMYCFHYDASEGRYAPVAFNIMKLGGAITVIVLGVFMLGLWMIEKRRGKKES